MFICANPQGQSAGVNRRTRQYNDQKKKDIQIQWLKEGQTMQ